MNAENYKNIIISKLFSIGAIKTGNFTLKSGKTSNLYFDMRLIMSYPNIFNHIMQYFLLKNPDFLNDIDIISGIHFGGLPLANYISHKWNIPQIYIRDNVKNYGLSKTIEGHYKQNDRLLLIDDVMTSGGSIKEKVPLIEENNINLSKILVILDRSENVNMDKLYSVFTLDDINRFLVNMYGNKYYDNLLSNKLYNLAFLKKTNIILSCDLDDMDKILELVDKVHENIIGIKIHIDLIKNLKDEHYEKLRNMKELYQLIIIEDRKVADIGFIAVKQLQGTHKINEWADYITSHPITGHEMFEAIGDAYPNLGIIMVSELSTKNNLISPEYIANSVAMLDNVSGIVSQSKIYEYIHPFQCPTLSPGINLDVKGDNYGQQYKKANSRELYNMGLFHIVGRGIYMNDEPIEASLKYKNSGWEYFINF
jgi:uridine monophosphate synthetase